MKIYSYYTELDIEECKKRINEAIKAERFKWCGLRGKVYLGKNKFRLFKARINGKNTFTRFFYGELIRQDKGTIINGEFRMYTLEYIYAIVWYTIAILITLSVFLYFLYSFIFGTSFDIAFFLAFLIGDSLILILPTLQIILGNKEESKNYVLYIMKTTLNATKIENLDEYINENSQKISKI